jgi:hypothetical protein
MPFFGADAKNVNRSQFLPHMFHKLWGGRQVKRLKRKINASFYAVMEERIPVDSVDYKSLQLLITSVSSAYVFTKPIAAVLLDALEYEKLYSCTPSPAFVWDVCRVLRSVRRLDEDEPSFRKGSYSRKEWDGEITRLTQSVKDIFSNGKHSVASRKRSLKKVGV